MRQSVVPAVAEVSESALRRDLQVQTSTFSDSVMVNLLHHPKYGMQQDVDKQRSRRERGTTERWKSNAWAQRRAPELASAHGRGFVIFTKSHYRR